MNVLILPPYLFLSSSLISLLAIGLIWPLWSIKGIKWIIFTLAVISLWNFSDLLVVTSPGLSAKLFWVKFENIEVCFIMPLTLLFFMNYSINQLKLKRLFMAFVFLVPFASMAAVLTNQWPHQFWTGINLGSSSRNLSFLLSRGPFLGVIIGFNLLCGLLVLIIILGNIWVSRGLYRSHFELLLIPGLIPFLGWMLFFLGMNPFSGLDYLPLFFSLAGVGIVINIFFFHLFERMPVAMNTVINNMADGVIVMDNQYRILDINPSARHLLGLDQEKIFGENAFSLFQSWPGLIKLIQSTHTGSKEVSLGEGKAKRYFHIQISPISDPKRPQEGQVIVLRDITPIIHAHELLQSHLNQIQSLQSELQEQAIRDPLTNLYNRRYLNEVLDREFARALREGYPVSLVMADIDHFKEVNDTYGHHTGDIVLQSVAKQFTQMSRAGDIVCRYGGEEFLMVLPNVDITTAAQRAEELRLSLNEILISSTNNPIKISLSFGVASYPNQGQKSPEVIAMADEALYQAKTKGRNRVVSSLNILQL